MKEEIEDFLFIYNYNRIIFFSFCFKQTVIKPRRHESSAYHKVRMIGMAHKCSYSLWRHPRKFWYSKISRTNAEWAEAKVLLRPRQIGGPLRANEGIMESDCKVVTKLC